MAVAGLSALFTSVGARAACGDPKAFSLFGAPKMPFLAQMAGEVSPADSNSIVGLWHVTYESGGEEFYEAFDQWHSDGTEFENAYVIPTEGNVCEGVWKQVASHTIRLSHIGWNFDANGNPAGTFTLTETNFPCDAALSEKLVEHAMSAALRSLQEAGGQSFFVSPRKTTDGQGSIGDKRVYILRRRDAKKRIPAQMEGA